MITKRGPSLRDVAKLAGVHISTASYALRDCGNIAAETRAKVKEAAKQLKYHPNPVLASLARGRFKKSNQIHNALAFISLHNRFHQNNHPRFKYAQAHAEMMGYTITYHTLESIAAWKNPERVLVNRGVAGVIFDGNSVPDIPNWNPSVFVTVLIGGIASERDYHRVNADHYAAVRTAWTKATAAGYKRIGLALLRHDPELEDDRLRYAAGLVSQIQHDPHNVIPCYRNVVGAEKGLVSWFQENRLDCVIGFHSGLYYLIKEAGYCAPEDYGFICLHVSPGTYSQLPEFTGIKSDEALKAQTAIELIDQQIRRRLYGIPDAPLSVLVEPLWIEGRTIRPQLAK